MIRFPIQRNVQNRFASSPFLLNFCWDWNFFGYLFFLSLFTSKREGYSEMLNHRFTKRVHSAPKWPAEHRIQDRELIFNFRVQTRSGSEFYHSSQIIQLYNNNNTNKYVYYIKDCSRNWSQQRYVQVLLRNSK